MANARKSPYDWEVLATTGTVTPNSRFIKKRLIMSGNVTLNPPADYRVGDDYIFHITKGAHTLTLDAAYVSVETTPPTPAANIVMRASVLPDATIAYWFDVNGA